ncbi:MAG: hypothetical protein KatS3mg110_2346 [Pirellulaceae bacterium]|nr:MAG: hypothetical protein KatS3mg110_2346 [Pirellulaceae bacterium]
MWNFIRDILVGSPPGLQRRLVHDYPWPHWTAVLLILMGWLFVWLIYRRETGRRSLRLAAALLRAAAVLLLVAVFLYGWQVVTDVTDVPDLVVLVDDSSSMLHPDVAPPDVGSRSRISRWEWVQRRLRGDGWLETWRERYRVKLFRIAGDVRPVAEPQADDSWQWDSQATVHQASRLGEALRSVVEQQRGRPTAAIVLFSDGVVTDGIGLAEAAADARRLAIPVYTVGVGDPKPSRDFAITDILGDDAVFVGDVAHFDVRLAARTGEKESLSVRVRRKESEQVLAERSVPITPDTPTLTVPLAFRADTVGDWELVFELEAARTDTNPGNNKAERRLSVRDEMLRVLYVQQYPSFDYRYLKQLLERGLLPGRPGQKAIQLHVVLQEADAEIASIDASIIRAFPVDRGELYRYDVVVFGDVDPAYFPSSLVDNLVAFVEERGGGLVVIAGPRHTPWAYRATRLARLLPAPPEQIFPPSDSRSGYQVALTGLGRSSPLVQLGASEQEGVWSGMPPLYWMAQARQLRPAARTLLEARAPDGTTWPLLLVQFVGAGKVVMLMTDESFRWARHPDGEIYYARFWLQILRYLSRSKLWGNQSGVELEVERERYQPGEVATITVRFLDERQAPVAEDGVTVLIEHSNGQRQSLVLTRDSLRRGLFRGGWPARSEGEYRVWLAAPVLSGQPPAARFSVVASGGEQARLELDGEQLRRCAEVSGGKYFTIDQADRLLEHLPAGRKVRIESLPPRPLWNTPLVAMLFIVLLTAEWIIRKWGGMV